MKPFINTTASMSIVWGITLAFLTLMDWNTLEKDPVSEDILTPFITRHITVTTAPSNSGSETLYDDSSMNSAATAQRYDSPAIQYQVELQFNNVLFLICFFGPPLAFYGLGQLARKTKLSNLNQ